MLKTLKRACGQVTLVGSNGDYFDFDQDAGSSQLGYACRALRAGLLGWSFVLEALKGVSTGNAAPLFYKLGASTSYKTHMHDVTTGSNGCSIASGYQATVDWDHTTGWESVNGTSALAYFKAHP